MSPARERTQVADVPPTPALLQRVRSVLQSGGLVILPTETVYGIAARADSPAAIERLCASKDRPPKLGFTWHVGSVTALERFDPISPMARRLAARYWPGPLTLVLPGVPTGLELCARDGWTGIRMPAQQTTAGILDALEFPVVMTSANQHGEPPATTAEEAEAAFHGGVDFVVDGGPSRLSESSSVLRLGRGKLELLRPGLFTIEQLRAVAGLRIAFVCTGNTCRSPMAEALARELLSKRLQTPIGRIQDFGFVLQSMGVSAAPGAPAAKLAIDVLAEDGVDLADHRARTATLEEVMRIDRVYGMTRAHMDELRRLLPPGKDKHVQMLDPMGEDIPDPIGGSRADYVSAAKRIRGAIEARLDEWA